MPNQNYQRGRALEYNVLNKLKSLGYDGLRSAGSHSPIDIIVWKLDDEWRNGYPDWDYKESILKIYAIQCKHSTSGDINFNSLFKEDNVKKLTEMPDNFTKVLCIKQPRSREIIQLVYVDYKWKLKKVFEL